MKILYPDSISGYPDIRILYPDIRILYPKLVCFGYHFLENLPDDEFDTVQKLLPGEPGSWSSLDLPRGRGDEGLTERLGVEASLDLSSGKEKGVVIICLTQAVPCWVDQWA